MAESIGIGIIGASGIAENAHVPGYLQQPDARLVAVADVVVERARSVAAKFDIPNVYPAFEELLANPDVEAVSIATSNASHAPIAMAALNAGKHVFCEKPPAISADEARRMQALAYATGKTLYFCFNNRFRSDVQQLKRYVDAGELGEIYYAKAANLRRRGSPGGWFANKRISGGGALIDIGVHCIDWARYLMGNPDPVEIFGQTFSKIKTYDLDEPRTWLPAELRGAKELPADRAGDVDEAAMAVIKFANGATLFVEVSWTLNTEDREYTEIFGTKAGASLRPLKILRNEYGRMVSLEVRLPDREAQTGHARAIRNFLDAVEGKADPIVTPKDGVDLMRILDGIYASAEAGRSVHLGEPSTVPTVEVVRPIERVGVLALA